jgi:hypothetical protein
VEVTVALDQAATAAIAGAAGGAAVPAAIEPRPAAANATAAVPPIGPATGPGEGRGVARITLFAVGDVEYAVAGRILRTLPAPAAPPPGSDRGGAELPAGGGAAPATAPRVRHGDADYPVADLPRALGAPLAPGAEPLLLLVDDGGVRRALLVERLVGAEPFDPGAVQPIPAVYPEPERRRWRGALPRPGGRVTVLVDLAGLP